MVTANPDLQTNQTTYFDNSILGGSITINFGLGDAIPYASIVNLSIFNTSGNFDKSSQKTIIDIFGSNAPSINDPGVTSDKDINNPDASWEAQQIKTYNFSDTRSYAINLKDFNLNVPDVAQGSKPKTFKVIFNITWASTTSFNITTTNKEITVRSNNISSISGMKIINSSGTGSFFRVGDYINCTATIKDDDNDEPKINATFWGPSKSYFDPSKKADGNVNGCTGTSWDTGKSCSISTQITPSDVTKDKDFGYWNCSMYVYDGYGMNISNSSLSADLLSMQNTPVIFVGKFSNQTWTNDTKKDSAFNLVAASTSGDGFYDPDSTLNFSVKGNHSINVTIDSNNNVNLVGNISKFIGKEYIVFNASDITSSVLSNNISLNISVAVGCAPNWDCEEWSECTNNLQFRSCTDLNNCDSSQLTKTENQTCIETLAATCSDGIQNQNETEVDCGGPCPACAPAAPVQTAESKLAAEQAAKANKGVGSIGKTALIGLGVIIGLGALGAGGFFLYKFLTKPKKPLINLETQPARREETKLEEIKLKPREREEFEAKPVNISELKNYIKSALAAKKPLNMIKNELIKAGWGKEQVEAELNLVSLISYIQSKLDQGVKVNSIKEGLKAKGWKEEQIEEAFKGLKSKPLF